LKDLDLSLDIHYRGSLEPACHSVWGS